MQNKYINWSKKSDQERLISSLHQNKIALGPSDTIPGFLCKASKKTFLCLNSIKKRCGKKYIILISNIKTVENVIDKKQIKLAKYIANIFWPGPLTMILKINEKSKLKYAQSETEQIAFRCPNNEMLLKILETIPKLFSTSANESGQKASQTISEVDQALIKKVDLVINENPNQLKNIQSTIIELFDNKLKIIRIGAISKENLIEKLQFLFKEIN